MDVETSQIREKVNELQKYVPVLVELINELRKDNCKVAKLKEMQLFHNLLTNPDKAITMSMLTECEETLKACFGRGKENLRNLDTSGQFDAALSTSSAECEKNDNSQTSAGSNPKEVNGEKDNQRNTVCLNKVENSSGKISEEESTEIVENLLIKDKDQLEDGVQSECDSRTEPTSVSEIKADTLRETKMHHEEKIVDIEREESIEVKPVLSVCKIKIPVDEEAVHDSDVMTVDEPIRNVHNQESEISRDSGISRVNKIENNCEQNKQLEIAQDLTNLDKLQLKSGNSKNQKVIDEKLTPKSVNDNTKLESGNNAESIDVKSVKTSEKDLVEENNIIELQLEGAKSDFDKTGADSEKVLTENIQNELESKQEKMPINELEENSKKMELESQLNENKNNPKISEESENEKPKSSVSLESSENLKVEHDKTKFKLADSSTVIDEPEGRSAENMGTECESESEVEIVSVYESKIGSKQKSIPDSDERPEENLEKWATKNDEVISSTVNQSSDNLKNDKENSLNPVAKSITKDKAGRKEEKLPKNKSNQVQQNDIKAEATDDNVKDPLSLDKDLYAQARDYSNVNNVNQQQQENNTLAKLLISKADVERLVKLQELKRLLEHKNVSPHVTVETKHSDGVEKTQLKSKKPPSSSSATKEKPAVVYLIKKDPSKSIETIELLDSDDEYNKDDGDDDVILVSARGLKKQPTVKNQKVAVTKTVTAKKSKTSTVSQKTVKTVSAVAKKLTTSSRPMFAISAVQSFGTPPKSTVSTTTITNTTTKSRAGSLNANIKKGILDIDLKKNQLSSSLFTRSSTVSGTSLKKNNEYQQATLRVCTPIKESEVLSNNPKDFLSAFQSFSANKNENLKLLQSKTKTNKSTKRNVPPINDDSTTSCDSISYSSTSSNPIVPNRINDDQLTKEWLKNLITNILSPTQIKSKDVLEILQKSLEPERYHQLKTIIDSHHNPEEVCSCIVSEKVFCLLPDGRTTEKLQLIVKPINQVNINELNKEVRELFIKNDKLTETGKKLCQIATTIGDGKNANKILTTDRQNGQVTSRSRKLKYEIDDDEYAPNVSVDVGQEITQERRRSLRRDNKKIDWKPYFTYDEEDDDAIIAYQLKKPKIENRKKRLNGESMPKPMMSVEPAERERKKIKIESGTSIQTPFDTELLTPTWFESEDLEGSNSQPYAAPATDHYETSANTSIYEEGQSYASNDDSRMEENAPENNEIPSSVNVEKVLVTKNISPVYHCRSKYIDACLVCGEKVQHAVSHYVNQHPDQEVIISRITQKDVEYILQNVNYAFITNQRQRETIIGRGYQYTAICVFCKRDMNFALRYWWEHFTMHTGEYGYECSGCKVKRPRKQSTQVHINGQCKKNKKAKVKEIYEFDKSITEIYAHICTICNYIQLHRANVEKHLRTQHEMSLHEIQSHIAVASLIQFAKPYMEAGGAGDHNRTTTDPTATGILEYNSADISMAEFMEYSNVMQSSDDLSFMICNMLATDVPELEQKNDIDESIGEQSNKKNTK